MAGILRVRRSRGAISGLLLVLLGLWGGLIAFIGPYFGYAFTPDTTWTYTAGRLFLEILPGACAIIGGLVIMLSAWRPFVIVGSSLAALSGAWFAIGGIVSPLWSHSPAQGAPTGGTLTQVVEQIGFFTGLGVVIVFIAASVFGRMMVITASERRVAMEQKVERPTGPRAIFRKVASARPGKDDARPSKESTLAS